jgi:hypothetical protein
MLLRMALEMNVSFRSLCECHILRTFVAEEVGWNLPSRMTLHRLLPAYHAHVVSTLRERLVHVDSLCITTDSTFLTRHQVPYICITGHWIDADWQLHDEVLAVFLAEQSETANFISTRLREVLETQLGVGRKVHCVTTDEGQNFLAAVEMLKSGEVIKESIRCACHRVQLMMKNAFTHPDCAALKELLDKCSTIVNVFKNGWASTKRDILLRYQKQHIEQLQRDLAELEADASHSTRAAADAVQLKHSMLREANILLQQQKVENDTDASTDDSLNNELLDVSVISYDSLSQAADEKDDAKEEIIEDFPENDTEAKDQEIERLMASAAESLASADYKRAFVDYIFNKRALIQKAATRWLSYVYVVERCVIWHKPLMNALSDIRNNRPSGRLRDVDWDTLKITDVECNTLTQFLIVGRACKQVIVSLEGAHHTTVGSLLWHYYRLYNYLSELIEKDEADPKIIAFCRKTVENASIKFTAKVDKVAMISVLLDPRFKSLSFMTAGDAGKCKDSLHHAYTDIEIEMEGIDSISEIASTVVRKKRRINKPEVYTDFTADILDAASPLKEKQVRLTELDRYQLHPQESDRKSDPLSWWKLHAVTYPKLAILARRYLAIPASSAASERLFSKLKLTATAQRQALKPETLCMLLFVTCHENKLVK